ncbi:conserved hypothetical protein [Ferrimonas balearica DSM 9799]|uniref:DUF3306 domain-containing protein n=1 Tax=Ferrimonas balearica (strain DSM 9799 / CCM 4581 / KCTC 23876 / PAT) TaxID=550540 RepID=E1SPH3_FERBD|nr:DUF3306 domain-containing protein [Ferrimonas balearica]ADN77790.1 conserved hypothetical protein [Ferrimonas balearica DSM 9799]MBW3140843.1 DUF3306 domain-containing protein [Ferrimonas balearica]MBW3165954.1 DUF3306 domain-containing protein [Ferrimonas balearica]MBY5981864.1 DUF3306 domain-containing protein [Ferrimonas balearica]MBY6108132.1 DUF3306 domain-containing protein [Ferrimonas balearica]
MSFLSRWQQRKAEVAKEAEEAELVRDTVEPVDDAEPTAEAAAPVEGQTEAQVEAAAEEAAEAEALPDPTSIEQGGSFADYLKPGVDPTQRKEALRALWKQPQYNIRDGLCEYDLDYAAQPKLTAAVAAEVAKKVFRHVTEAVEQVDEAVAQQETKLEAADSERAEGVELAQAESAQTPSELPNVREDIGQNDPQEGGETESTRSQA